jgi:predicted MPP superfamily phosphohydrolase
MILALFMLAAVGHVILWVACVNRLHALGIKRIWIHLLTIGCGLALAAIPLAIALVLDRGSIERWTPGSAAVWCYLAACSALSIFSVARWWRLRRHHERIGSVFSNHTTVYHPSKSVDRPLTAPGIPTWLARLPFNEALDIYVHEKELAIPRLSSQHDGIRIAHLSDLHMSGRICQDYFQQVVEHVNRLEPDLVAITGDLVEREKCLRWIPETLGRLSAPAGVFYVLGNHDRHVDTSQLHAALARAGLTHIGGRWQPIPLRNSPAILAGNELPWYTPAADMSDCPPNHSAGVPLRILMSHSPDQFRWAQEHDFDLMLAGHNHGGQVRLPIIGPFLAPSRHGVRYAAGAFRAGNTVMHVSRGTSCLTPFRYNCPPEIAVLVLCTT